MTAAISAALRACAAGLYPAEAGVELLISHDCFLHRHDFTRFVHTGTSITDGTTPMAGIDWDAAITALHAGQLPASSGERRILQLARAAAGWVLEISCDLHSARTVGAASTLEALVSVGRVRDEARAARPAGQRYTLTILRWVAGPWYPPASVRCAVVRRALARAGAAAGRQEAIREPVPGQQRAS